MKNFKKELLIGVGAVLGITVIACLIMFMTTNMLNCIRGLGYILCAVLAYRHYRPMFKAKQKRVFRTIRNDCLLILLILACSYITGHAAVKVTGHTAELIWEEYILIGLIIYVIAFAVICLLYGAYRWAYIIPKKVWWRVAVVVLCLALAGLSFYYILPAFHALCASGFFG